MDGQSRWLQHIIVTVCSLADDTRMLDGLCMVVLSRMGRRENRGGHEPADEGQPQHGVELQCHSWTVTTGFTVNQDLGRPRRPRR